MVKKVVICVVIFLVGFGAGLLVSKRNNGRIEEVVVMEEQKKVLEAKVDSLKLLIKKRDTEINETNILYDSVFFNRPDF